MNINEVKNSIFSETGDINQSKIDARKVWSKPTFWSGFASGVISSLVATAIWSFFHN